MSDIPWDLGSPPSLESIGAQNYLGSPSVVAGLAKEFTTAVHNLIIKLSSGGLSQDNFLSEIDAECSKYSDIFMGKNSDYNSIAGWNTPETLGMKLKRMAGMFAIDGKPFVGGYIGFHWLAMQVLLAYSAIHIDGEDADVTGHKLAEIISDFTELLLGIRDV